MRQWRVGTLSTGLILFLLGFSLLLFTIKGEQGTRFILDWWPVALIVLGGEIVIGSFLIRKEGEQARLKFDLLSIFLAFIICAGSFGLYFIQTTGIVGMVQKYVSNRNVMVELERNIPETQVIQKVMIDNPGDVPLTIQNVKADQAKITGSLSVFVEHEDSVQQWKSYDPITLTRDGELLVIQVKQPADHYRFDRSLMRETLTLWVPSNWSVDIKNEFAPLDLVLRDSTGNWTISTDGSTDLRLVEQSSALVEANMDHRANLQGNIDWKISERTSFDGNGPTDVRDENPNGPVKAVYEKGKDGPKITIIKSGHLTVADK